MSNKTFNLDNFEVPQYLPLLEGLCWNINNPYALTPQEMLGIYEERWHFKDVLAAPNQEEETFIKQIIKNYQGLPLLMTDKVDKQALFECVDRILTSLDRELLEKHQAILRGGALVGLKYQQIRTSRDMDFLIDPQNYRKLKLAINRGASIFRQNADLEVRQPRIDRYGIRYPLSANINGAKIPFKVEIVAEDGLKIDKSEKVNNTHNILCLNHQDRCISKLLANGDRWGDRSKFSRDLIDLAVIAAHDKIPTEATTIAKNIYADALECLKLAIKQFQNLPDYRNKCYEALDISQPEIVINGLDYLAKKFNLEPTERSHKETDYSYKEAKSQRSKKQF